MSEIGFYDRSPLYELGERVDVVCPVAPEMSVQDTVVVSRKWVKKGTVLKSVNGLDSPMQVTSGYWSYVVAVHPEDNFAETFLRKRYKPGEWDKSLFEPTKTGEPA